MIHSHNNLTVFRPKKATTDGQYDAIQTTYRLGSSGIRAVISVFFTDRLSASNISANSSSSARLSPYTYVDDYNCDKVLNQFVCD
jgi:hypothetical protein